VARGLFVTGTDTGVGKTVVSAALFHRYRALRRLRYWKPIQTGIEQDDDTATVSRLGACLAEEIFADGVRLERPVSPHLAARLAGVSIDLDELLAPWQTQPHDPGWVIEGAGGLMVPISESTLMVDLIDRLNLAVLVVARSTLGTINHTLLTLEALRRRQIEPAGVVVVGPPHPENVDAIRHYGATRVLGALPWLDPLTPATLGGWAARELDAGRYLEAFF
jgi:dethiobiotin synthase